MRQTLAFIALTLALMMGLSKASGEPLPSGLSVTGYRITDIPPERSDTLYPQCGNGWYSQINYTWDYEQNLFADCGWDSFMLHYKGFITIPENVNSVRFAIASDDGSDVTIDGKNFGNWTDKGCSIDYSDRYQLDTNTPLKLDAWFYENGGGTCFMLMWQFNDDSQDWQIVPDSAFQVVSQTTQNLPTTSIQLEAEPELLPVSTTLEPQTTTSLSSTSTTSTVTTSTTIPAETTTTVEQPTPNSTTTSIATVVVSTTPTTVQPLPDIPQTSFIVPTTTLPKPINEFIKNDISETQAVELATNPNVIKSLSTQEAATVFSAINENELTDEQGLLIVNAVQNAPEQIRKVFEKKINVFAGKTDTYIPVGSLVTVGQRRVIIVTSLVLVATPSVLPRRKYE